MTRVPLRTKLAYGFGAIAYGIKDNGFSVFLLIFYNQVIGLPADQVGVAIMVALIIDAFIDPAIGTLSDRTNTRWGRRHPWLYASVIPVAICWVLLWNPPDASQGVQFAWLISTAVLVRFALACNEVPSVALVPEMTRDYHERTVVLRYRYLFGWAGGLAMLMLAFGVLLKPEAGATAGQLNAEGYEAFALVGAVVMAISVFGAALGTHRLYAKPPATAIPRETFGATLRGMRATLSNRAFLTLMAAGMFSFANQGVVFALTNYLLTFVWQFSSGAFLFYAIGLFAGVVAAFFAVAPLSKRLGKKQGAATLAVTAAVIGTSPYWLRLADLFPAPGSPILLPLFIAIVSISTGLGVAVMILTGSMMADVVEASEATTGKREEGLFVAGYFFMQKSVTGIGIFLSGMILTLAAFPPNAVPGAVPDAVLDRLTLLFAILIVAFAAISAVLYMRFPIDHEAHESRLRELAVASGDQTIF